MLRMPRHLLPLSVRVPHDRFRVTGGNEPKSRKRPFVVRRDNDGLVYTVGQYTTLGGAIAAAQRHAAANDASVDNYRVHLHTWLMEDD